MNLKNNIKKNVGLIGVMMGSSFYDDSKESDNKGSSYVPSHTYKINSGSSKPSFDIRTNPIQGCLTKKEFLEKTVEKLTPVYSCDKNLNNAELINAHLELSSLYSDESNEDQAKTHFKSAMWNYNNLVEGKNKQPQYRQSTDLGVKVFEEQRKAIVEELKAYEEKIFDTAKQIGYSEIETIMSMPKIDRRGTETGLDKVIIKYNLSAGN